MLLAAAGIADAAQFTHVVAGMQADDHQDYPDCRPEFLAAMPYVVRLSTEGRVQIDGAGAAR
jgi:7-cyano-7-deazaguanine synthase